MGERAEGAERAEGVTLLAVVAPGDIVIAAKPYGEVALTSSNSTSWRSTRATTAATGGGLRGAGPNGTLVARTCFAHRSGSSVRAGAHRSEARDFKLVRGCRGHATRLLNELRPGAWKGTADGTQTVDRPRRRSGHCYVFARSRPCARPWWLPRWWFPRWWFPRRRVSWRRLPWRLRPWPRLSRWLRPGSWLPGSWLPGSGLLGWPWLGLGYASRLGPWLGLGSWLGLGPPMGLDSWLGLGLALTLLSAPSAAGALECNAWWSPCSSRSR